MNMDSFVDEEIKEAAVWCINAEMEPMLKAFILNILMAYERHRDEIIKGVMETKNE